MLTERQQLVLDTVTRFIQETGFPPTRAELANTLGFKSANAAEDHLRALERKGVIELIAGSSRGIRLKSQAAAPAYESLKAGSLLRLMLPLIGRVAAGSPVLATEHIETEIAVDPHLFVQQPDYLLKVKGQSMQDIGIMDGDLLAVKKQTQARDGQIVVARIDGDVTVKRFKKEKDHIALIAENAQFKPIIVRDNPSFAIEGLAVGLIRAGFAGGL